MNLLTQAIIYLIFGILFTFFAIRHVSLYGWGFFAYLLVFFATLDIGSSIKIFYSYWNSQRNKRNIRKK
ncbi:YdiK family protein [Caldibacillus thermolactis]|uniref:YdiK family protein n=1 Tax=Pallidibacillus thermolactis TaxID=251051 RepID=A0ABT2WIT0_9BACI|nr:YdiK family protein [Pallidibacillus thermolactis]MCU9595600.1 YdiK family protein [Pallidibacillus thermolactis]MCU9602505.1 YdiK family protein [Pallidibacillus thermolactis subsp. kokeshiiformis]MED1672282.1 YdiK family protein [Pallidibacillus thermolactis subsp. kokeshiiformis]